MPGVVTPLSLSGLRVCDAAAAEVKFEHPDNKGGIAVKRFAIIVSTKSAHTDYKVPGFL
jgi:hypothetical protein